MTCKAISWTSGYGRKPLIPLEQEMLLLDNEPPQPSFKRKNPRRLPAVVDTWNTQSGSTELLPGVVSRCGLTKRSGTDHKCYE